MNCGDPPAASTAPGETGRDGQEYGMYPLALVDRQPAAGGGEEAYLRDPATRQLLAFFAAKGLHTLKEEDRRERWYEDWLAYQAERGLYAAVLSPAKYSTRDGCFDLLRYGRFLEAFAYCSPAHGYSLQVSFLGLFAILLGSNEALKREAVVALEAGQLLAFAVSERGHGSDLLANEFSMTQIGAGKFLANGAKFYIGNANAAAMIAILGTLQRQDAPAETRPSRRPFMLMALRPGHAAGFHHVAKIHTLGVRAAHVGAFEVRGHEFPQTDVIAQGREAWDAVFGTVTLGKFFLGFGSIGICEHAFQEALAHLQTRVLYGKPVLAMPHIRAAMVQAFARLTAMKLYAYRALDYLDSASQADRRYLLFCAVQKARVSTEAVKVMALLSECVGARGFDADTYMEMALRDVQLIPGLEGSMHINLRLATQFMPRYFDAFESTLIDPPSLATSGVGAHENAYLQAARSGPVRSVGFRPFLEAYHAWAGIANVAMFARQAAAFRRVARRLSDPSDSQVEVALGHAVATVVYGQLVAENATRVKLPRGFVSAIFGLLVADLDACALQLASSPQTDGIERSAFLRMVKVPRTSLADLAMVAQSWSASS